MRASFSSKLPAASGGNNCDAGLGREVEAGTTLLCACGARCSLVASCVRSVDAADTAPSLVEYVGLFVESTGAAALRNASIAFVVEIPAPATDCGADGVNLGCQAVLVVENTLGAVVVEEKLLAAEM